MRIQLGEFKDAVIGLIAHNPLLALLIVIFSATPFYHEKVSAYFPLYVILFTTVILQVYLLQHIRRRLILSLSAVLIGAALYVGYSNIDNYGLQQVILNISALWGFTCAILYFTSLNDDYIEEIVNRIKRVAIAGTATAVLGLLLFIIILFASLITKGTVLTDLTVMRYVIALDTFLFFSLICSYDRQETKTDDPSAFYTILLGEIVPKVSILTGILANIYLLLMLIGIREDSRFLYTYYPYVTLFYLFYLSSFRIHKESKTQTVLCVLFIAITVLCLLMIGKRLYHTPYLMLNSIYLILFNSIFLVYNVYTLIRRIKPGKATSIMAFLLGLVMFMPVVGYTSFYTFTYYTKTDNHWTAHFSVIDQFSSLPRPVESLDKDEIDDNYPIIFNVSLKNEPIDVRDYTTIVPDLELYINKYSDETSDMSNSSVEAGRLTFSLSEDGDDLIITTPQKHIKTYPVSVMVKTALRSYPIQPIIITENNYRIYIYNYNQNPHQSLIKFTVLYK